MPTNLSFCYDPFESKDVAVRPDVIIDLYKNSYKNISNLKNIERKKKIIELYQTSLFALGLTSIDSKEYWVKLHDSISPDTEIIFFGEMINKRVSSHKYMIENTCPRDFDITKAIMDKVVGKDYTFTEPVLLLLYIENENLKYDYESLKCKLDGCKKNPFSRIWSLCRLSENEFKITQIYPIVKTKGFNLDKAIAGTAKQASLLKFENKYFVKPNKNDYKISFRVD